MPSMMCVACSNGEDSVEFATVRDYVDHEKGGHVSRPVKVLPPSPDKGPSRTELPVVVSPIDLQATVITKEEPIVIPPLELQYRWIGRHKDCNMEVKTITIDMEEKEAIIAYCVNCDKKLEQEMVIPILNQLDDESFEKKIKKKA